MKKRVLLEFALGVALLAGSPAWADDDERAIKAANDLLAEVSKAYSTLPAMTDELKVTFEAKGQPDQTATTKVRFAGRNVAAEGIATMVDVTVIDGTMYATMVGDTENAIKAELGDDPMGATRTSLDMIAAFLPHHFGLRWSNGVEGLPALFGMGIVADPIVSGHRMVDHKGSKVHAVMIKGSNDGTSRVLIDPKTKLVHSIVTTGVMMEMGGGEVTVTTKCKPKAVDSLSEAITFDAGERTMHATFQDMMMAGMGAAADLTPGIEIGTKAPGFELVDQDGKTHTLDSYAGQVVVMDWWGIW